MFQDLVSEMKLLAWLRQIFSAPPNTASLEELDSPADPLNPFPEPITVEITDIIDLHTIPPRQVKAVVEEYLQQAWSSGFPVVRIIHGKGIGVQREIVRSVLAQSKMVAGWADAPPQAGGLGATIVRLKAGPNAGQEKD